MSINLKLFIHLLCSVLCTAVVATAADADPKTAWKQILQERIPLYGHRNWIVIADSAYPAQSRDGIETIVSGASQIEVLKQVLADLSSSRHIRPIIYTDRELSFVNEADASGIDHYRQQLSVLLPTAKVTSLPHEEIINKLDQAGQTFRVLIIKTDLTIPLPLSFSSSTAPIGAPKRSESSGP